MVNIYVEFSNMFKDEITLFKSLNYSVDIIASEEDDRAWIDLIPNSSLDPVVTILFQNNLQYRYDIQVCLPNLYNLPESMSLARLIEENWTPVFRALDQFKLKISKNIDTISETVSTLN